MPESCYKFIQKEIDDGSFNDADLKYFDGVVDEIKKEFYKADEYQEILADVSKLFVERKFANITDNVSNKFFFQKGDLVLKDYKKSGNPDDLLDYISYVTGIKGVGAGKGQQASRMSLLEAVRPTTTDYLDDVMKKSGLYSDFVLMRSGTKYGDFLDESVDFIRRGGKSKNATANRLAKVMDTVDNEQIARLNSAGIRIKAEPYYGSAQLHIRERIIAYESETGNSWKNDLMKKLFSNPYSGANAERQLDVLLDKMYKEIMSGTVEQGKFSVNYQARTFKPVSPEASVDYSRIMGFSGAYNNFVSNQVKKNFDLESYLSFGAGGFGNVEKFLKTASKAFQDSGDVKNFNLVNSGRVYKKWEAIKDIFKPVDFVAPDSTIAKSVQTLKSLTNHAFLSKAVFVEYASAIGNAYPLHRSLGHSHWKSFASTVDQIKEPLQALFSGVDGDKIYKAAKEYLNLSVLSSDIGSSSFSHNVSSSAKKTFLYAKKLEDTLHKYNGLNKMTFHNKIKGGLIARDSLVRKIEGNYHGLEGVKTVDGGVLSDTLKIFSIGDAEIKILSDHYKKHKNLSVKSLTDNGVPREVVERVNALYQKYSSILSASGNFSSHIVVDNIGSLKLTGAMRYMINALGTQYLSIGNEASRNFNYLVNVLNKTSQPVKSSWLKEGFSTLASITDLGGVKSLATVGVSTTLAFYLKGRLSDAFSGKQSEGFEKDMAKAFFYSDALNPLYQDMVYSFLKDKDGDAASIATNIASFPSLSYINSSVKSIEQGRTFDTAVKNFVPFANQFYTSYARKKFVEKATGMLSFNDEINLE